MEIGGRKVAYRAGNDTCLITFYADFDKDSLEALLDQIPEATIAAIHIDDWNRELSPWDAPPVFGDEGFGHGASGTLQFITDVLIPAIGCRSYVIGGYSLAGLFSLWACYSTDVFDGCASPSPSVWFPDWDSFIQRNSISAKRVYLSLGDKESKTKNSVMRTVSDRIWLQYELLEASGVEAVLEWNPGGHFKDVGAREVKAFRWILNSEKTERPL